MIDISKHMSGEMLPRSGQHEYLCKELGANALPMLGNEDDHILDFVQYLYAKMH
jgi:hypothetical protein